MPRSSATAIIAPPAANAPPGYHPAKIRPPSVGADARASAESDWNTPSTPPCSSGEVPRLTSDDSDGFESDVPTAIPAQPSTMPSQPSAAQIRPGPVSASVAMPDAVHT